MRVARKLIAAAFVLAVGTSAAIAQKRPKPAAPSRVPAPVIFAVVNDGASVEPIALFEKGKLTAPANGSDTANVLSAFAAKYYRPATNYSLIFGGSDAGSVSVKGSDINSDCGKNYGSVAVTSTRAKLKGNVMALATNIKSSLKGSGVRRLPTATERSEVDELVRSEFVEEKTSEEAVRKMDYHNLTAVDLDNDGKPEFIGSYFVPLSAKSMGKMFVVVEGLAGKYAVTFERYETVNESDVMSGNLADLADGVYNELLLDVFDVDGDGKAEVFTRTASFEGAGFSVYKKTGTKWQSIYEGSNYHCAY